MRIEPRRKLFIGVRIDNKMRDQLDKCPPRDRVFFESEDAKYLTVLRSEEEGYIGKLVDGTASVASLDDVRRNIMSILNRICPGRRDEEDVKVMAADEGDAPPPPPKKTAEDRRGYY